jgi:hypothetical protein
MPRDFTDVVVDLDDGKVHAQATKELGDVVRAVMETGKVGSLTVSFKIKRDRTRQVTVAVDIKSKPPQAATESTLFYATDDGELRRDDPLQQPLKHVPMKPPTPLKNVNAPSAKEE